MMFKMLIMFESHIFKIHSTLKVDLSLKEESEGELLELDNLLKEDNVISVVNVMSVINAMSVVDTMSVVNASSVICSLKVDNSLITIIFFLN